MLKMPMLDGSAPVLQQVKCWESAIGTSLQHGKRPQRERRNKACRFYSSFATIHASDHVDRFIGVFVELVCSDGVE